MRTCIIPYRDQNTVEQRGMFLYTDLIGVEEAEYYKISDEEVEYHIIWAVLAQQFSLKFGI